MSFQMLKTAVERFIGALSTTLYQTQGPVGHGLFINDNLGRFRLTAEPLVPELHLVEDGPTTTASTQAVETQGEEAVVFDIQTQTAIMYDGSVWSPPSTQLYVDTLKGSRLYYNPATQRVYYIHPNLSGQRMRWNA